MTRDELQALLMPVVDIAEQAGQAILDIYGDESRWAVQQKEDASPLTAADLASHNLIRQALARLTPDIPLLSEESSEGDIADRRSWPRCWMVDPLDGTKEFLKRNGDFTVNIALVDGNEAVLGVVHVPAQGMTYWGVRGSGAAKRSREAGGKILPLRVRDLSADDVPVVVASRHHRDVRGDGLLQAIAKEFGGYHLRNIGSALKTCLIAEGSADCYPRFGPTMEWDTAAAQVVLEEAGGFLCTPNGNTLDYNARDVLTNGSFLAAGAEKRRWLSCWKIS